jgi:hypothetical protein
MAMIGLSVVFQSGCVKICRFGAYPFPVERCPHRRYPIQRFVDVLMLITRESAFKLTRSRCQVAYHVLRYDSELRWLGVSWRAELLHTRGHVLVVPCASYIFADDGRNLEP